MKKILLLLLFYAMPVFATVSESESIRQYFECNGSTTTYTFTQACNSSDDILVYKRSLSTGVETLLTENADYTVASTGSDYLNGGVVTISPALSSSYAVAVVREIKKSQEVTAGAITPTSVVTSLDKLTRQIQDLEDRIDRSIHLQEADPDKLMVMPPVDEGYVYITDTNSVSIVKSVSTSSYPVSSYVQDLLDDVNNVEAMASLNLSDHTATLDLLNLKTRGPWADVTSFGAVGDDSTDDTNSIQDAIDNLPSEGGVLFFPDGVYKITTPITLGSKSIRVVGACSTANHTTSAVQIKNYGNDDAILINPSGAGTRCIIENIDIIDGYGLTRSEGDGIHAERTDEGGVSVDLRNVTVSGHYNGIYIIRGLLSRIVNCICWDNKNNGFQIASTAAGSGTSMTFDSCWAWNNSADGFYIDGYSYSRWVNCQADDNVNAYHVIKEGGGGNPNGLVFLGCGAEGNTGVGILLTDEDGISAITINGGQIYNSGSDGIQVNDAQNVTIQGVKLVLNGGYGVNAENYGSGRSGDLVLINNNYVSNTSGEVSDSNSKVIRIGDSNQDDVIVPTGGATGMYGTSGKVYYYGSTVAVNTSSGEAFRASGANFQVTNAMANGQNLMIKSKTSELTLSTIGTTSTLTDFIPAGSLVLGLSVRVTTAGESISTLAIGISGDTGRWGTGIAVDAGTTVDIEDYTCSYPSYYPSATSVLVTANGIASAGKVRLTIHYIQVTPPTS